jgi:2-beta-glucuronyltransferase
MSASMVGSRRVVLFTLHVWDSKRRAGFHWIADALSEMGWDVVFVTVAISSLSMLRQDYRVGVTNKIPKNQLINVKSQFRQFIWWTIWHPANLRFGLLNQISRLFFRSYGHQLPHQLREAIHDAEVLVFESTPGVVAFESILKINSNARVVYRVSDDLRLLKNHPVVFDFEQKLASVSDLISVPSAYLFDRFSRFPKTKLQYHGVNIDILDQDQVNPYVEGSINAIFTGVAHFDESFLEIASAEFPDVQFHIVGPILPTIRRKNVIYHGEMRFSDIVPFIKFADLGLHNMVFRPGAESFSDSLKVLHYSYFRLPILFPNFIPSSRLNVFKYQPDSRESIRDAVNAALKFSKEIQIIKPSSWKYLASLLVGDE